MQNYNLIIADDDRTVRNLLKIKSSHYGFRPITAENGAEVLPLINDNIDVILLDIHMPVMGGLECLKALSEAGNTTPVVMLSGEKEASIAMQAIKLGALDYLSKPFDLDELFTVLRNAKKISAIQKENNTLKETLTDSISSPTDNGGLIAYSPATIKVQKQALKIATLDSTVLLTGESGTGKGVFARYIHANSDRSDKPFITVSCPALPRELLESELFGHEKGAFTGAVKRRIGKIEAAEGGTIFLDEIGDLPIDLQPKLLNVLQDQEFTRIGGNKAFKSNVRIITATNINFKEKIANNEFREDLYYRISVILLELPPLRERIEEIMPLCQHFCHTISKSRNSKPIRISTEAEAIFQSYSWPGNVRQLENLIERASAFCDDHIITINDLPSELTKPQEEVNIIGLAGKTLAEIEALAIQQTLAHCGGNKAETSRMLGITEKSIYNKMKRHQL
jgi:DNA-binding NtrC family response regulator